MKTRFALIASIAAAFAIPAARPAQAHPHIFVDVGIEAFVDAKGRLTEVKVTWAYDALFSLLVTEDMGLDADGDAVLTKAEEAKLTGFDANWDAGYNGDLVGALGDRTLAFSRAKAPTAVMSAGRIVTTHRRDVKGRPKLRGRTLTFKAFDPTYYTAYDVRMGVSVNGLEGCKVDLTPPDLDTEMQSLQNELALLSQDQDTFEMGFPEVGESFATEIRITCAGS